MFFLGRKGNSFRPFGGFRGLPQLRNYGTPNQLFAALQDDEKALSRSVGQVCHS